MHPLPGIGQTGSPYEIFSTPPSSGREHEIDVLVVADDGADGFDEILHVHGLFKGGGGAEAFHFLIVDLQVTRHDDYRDGSSFLDFFQAFEDEISGTCGQVNVEKDKVRALLAGQLDAQRAVVCFDGFEARLAHDGGDPQTTVFVIFDDENFLF